jgi:signal transduction histidine kinase
LTLVYGAMILAVTTALVITTYFLVRQSMITEFQRLNVADLKDKRGVELPPGKVIALDSDGSPITLADLKSRITLDQQQALDATTGNLLTISVATAVVGGLVALVACWLMSGRVIRPLRVINDTAESIAHSNLHRRIRMSGPADELKGLADTFDAMLDRLDHSFDGQRRFVGNASHELRTPLAVSRTLIQVAMGRPDASADLRELGHKLLEINTRQTQLTDALLTLARSDQNLTEVGPVDLGSVCLDVIDQFRDAATQAEVEVITAVESAVVPGDSVLLTQLVTNLVSNAIAYNRPGGHVMITVDSAPTGDGLITVENTGDPIDPAAVAELFEPFRRLGPQRLTHPGVGLGLSIVRSIAYAHGGQVAATAGPDGGLIVRIELPPETELAVSS